MSILSVKRFKFRKHLIPKINSFVLGLLLFFPLKFSFDSFSFYFCRYVANLAIVSVNLGFLAAAIGKNSFMRPWIHTKTYMCLTCSLTCNVEVNSNHENHILQQIVGIKALVDSQFLLRGLGKFLHFLRYQRSNSSVVILPLMVYLNRNMLYLLMVNVMASNGL